MTEPTLPADLERWLLSARQTFLAVAARYGHVEAFDWLVREVGIERRRIDGDAPKQRCYVHTFVTIDKCGCPPDPSLLHNDGPEDGEYHDRFCEAMPQQACYCDRRRVATPTTARRRAT